MSGDMTPEELEEFRKLELNKRRFDHSSFIFGSIPISLSHKSYLGSQRPHSSSLAENKAMSNPVERGKGKAPVSTQLIKRERSFPGSNTSSPLNKMLII